MKLKFVLMKSILILLLFTVLLSCNRQSKIMLIDTTDSKFKVGQVWKYKTRPNEENSRLTIAKVENEPKNGNIIHITVTNLKIKNPHASSGYTDLIGRMPLAESAVAESATELSNEMPDLSSYKEGYQDWREAFDNGRGGIWTLPVSECVAAMEEVVNK